MKKTTQREREGCPFFAPHLPFGLSPANPLVIVHKSKLGETNFIVLFQKEIKHVICVGSNGQLFLSSDKKRILRPAQNPLAVAIVVTDLDHSEYQHGRWSRIYRSSSLQAG
ncbi:hypothetical protein [Cohnella nanjingensis]|uniref:hypothetical protein n=1 Tax=Cohnella nanjingensis TaxID=1387779 RepID=UPI001C868050|nr:hypothetical protein [Cohnella nanjingensis]